MTPEVHEAPYVLMQCVGCSTQYKIPLTAREDHPYCEKDYMPLFTVKVVVIVNEGSRRFPTIRRRVHGPDPGKMFG